jgi:hypothetical protein
MGLEDVEPSTIGRKAPRRFASDGGGYGYWEQGYDNPNSMYYGMGGPVYGDPGYGAYRAAVNSGTQLQRDEASGQWGFRSDHFMDWYQTTSVGGVRTQTVYLGTEFLYRSFEPVMQGGNLVISFLPTDMDAFKGSNWTVMNASCLHDALDNIDYYKKHMGKINNLIVFSHGGQNGLVLGDNTITFTDFEWRTHYADKFNAILNSVESGGNLAFVGCNAALVFGEKIQTYTRCDINIFMNGNLSAGEYRTINDQVLYRFNMDVGISRWTDCGVKNLTTGTLYKDIIIGSKGTITPIK